jgi:hypothetical protein
VGAGPRRPRARPSLQTSKKLGAFSTTSAGRGPGEEISRAPPRHSVHDDCAGCALARDRLRGWGGRIRTSASGTYVQLASLLSCLAERADRARACWESGARSAAINGTHEMRTQPAVAGAGLQGRKINVSGLEPEWLAMRLTDRARAGAFKRRMGNEAAHDC